MFEIMYVNENRSLIPLAKAKFAAESTNDAINYIGGCAVEMEITWYDPLGP